MSGGAWLPWALGSAAFAALTAILAKAGVAGIDPDLATMSGTAGVLCALGLLLLATGRLHVPTGVDRRSWCFLALSGLATGASWLCYLRALRAGDAARVAPVDKLSVVLVAAFGTPALGEQLSARAWVGVLLVGAGAIVAAIS